VSLKILLADDSVTAQNMGKKILSDAGFEVVAVSNGSAALKKIPDLKPDLVILDIYMPGYTGLEVCQKIKEARQTSTLPVLLTVGKLEPFKARDASRVRADGFIVKPFEATELLATIKRIVGILPEQTRKSKNGDESKTRVKQAKLASQEAEAEQLASTLRNVLPAETESEEHFESGADTGFEKSEEAVEADHEYSHAGESRPEPQPATERAPFPVNASAESVEEEDQAYKQCEVEAERDTARFRVDFEKPSKQEETQDESARFTASTFETWEQSRRRHYDAESRENALARIRAARETEATEQQETPGEGSESVAAASPETGTGHDEQTEPVAQVQAVSTEEPRAEIQQPETPSHAPEISSEPRVAHATEEQARNPHPPISGLADWAADLREDAPRATQTTSFASKWIAEEVALDSGESGVLLSQEIHRSAPTDSEPIVAPVRDAMQGVPETSPAQFSEDRSVIEPAAQESQPVENPEPAFAAEEQTSDQAQSAEVVAALAKAAAAAAMTSIGEIREAVLASAAAAGVAGSARDSMTVVPQVQPPVVDESSFATADASQFAGSPSAPADDVQGATIAAVTREVHEAEPADLNSDAIASIVNRVIEQMKPKLVAEIAKELTHKPKNE
jgi:DNA-binding response OmpR family regulator